MTDWATNAMGLKHLHLHRVSLRVAAYNLRAIPSYASCGFVEEGRERGESIWLDGRWWDDLIMGVLDSELKLN